MSRKHVTRQPATKPFFDPTLPRPGKGRCGLGLARHGQRVVLDSDLSLLGQPGHDLLLTGLCNRPDPIQDRGHKGPTHLPGSQANSCLPRYPATKPKPEHIEPLAPFSHASLLVLSALAVSRSFWCSLRPSSVLPSHQCSAICWPSLQLLC